MRIQVVMTDDQGAGIAVVQLFEQQTECLLLLLCACVGRFSLYVITALIAHADGVGVVVQTVGTDHIVRASALDFSVTPDNVVVADAEFPASLPVPCVDLRRRTGLVGLHG